VQIVISHNSDDAPLLRCLWSIATNPPGKCGYEVLVADRSPSGYAFKTLQWFSSVFEWKWLRVGAGAENLFDFVNEDGFTVLCHSGVMFGKDDLTNIADAWHRSDVETGARTINKVISPLILGVLDDHGANLTPKMYEMCNDDEQGSIVAARTSYLPPGNIPTAMVTLKTNALVHMGDNELPDLDCRLTAIRSNVR
jgi:hypothetical protein